MDNDHMKQKKNSVLLGVIPARSGSKGLKNKNLKKVLDKPLIYYTIKEAQNYDQIYKTIVTTDSSKIAEIAKKYGADVPFIRPKKLAKDNTSMLEVLKHALIKCERIYSSIIKGLVLFDPTSPLREKEEIKEMINIFLKRKPDLVVAVARSRKNPYFNIVKTNRNGYAQLVLKGNYIRRQDAPPVFDISNNCWIFSRQAVLRGWRIPRKTIPYEINSFYIDIDRKDDFKFLEWYLKRGEKT